MKRYLAGFLIISLLLPVGAVFAQGIRKTVHFRRGSTSTVIAGSVLRGDRDSYFLGARAGQRLRVRISSAEKNAAFQIARPSNRGTLAGAGEMDDATKWSGKLPVSGTYRIIVGGTRGNASYRLSISIK